MSSRKSTNILLVGGGVTSAVLSKLLTSELKNLNITVWEKQKVVGGRFFTSNCYIGDTSYSLELGAQYITTKKEVIKQNDKIYDSLLQSNVIVDKKLNVKGLKPMLDKTNFFAPNGMTSVIEFLFKNSKVEDILCDCELEKLIVSNDEWKAFASNGLVKLFDVVILTLPVPEVFNLGDDIVRILEKSELSKELCSVKYSSRYAIGVSFESPLKTECDSEYIYDSDVFRFVAFDGWRNSGSNLANSAMLHSTVQFGEENPNNTEDLKEKIIGKIYSEFSHWPKPLSVIVHQWKYSQVQEPYKSKPGAIIVSNNPLLIMGGDGFIGSTFDQCLYSARKISSILRCSLNSD